MRKIYIILTRSETMLSKLVHLITAAPYTHVSISFDRNMQRLYSSSRKNGRTVFPAGPCVESFHSGYFKRHPHTPCAIYELHVSDEVYDRVRFEVQMIMAMEDQYHFNIMGLLLCHFNIPLRRDYHFFCSQFVSEVLERSNALALPKETSLMRPGDYLEMPELLCCFKGRIKDYKWEYCG